MPQRLPLEHVRATVLTQAWAGAFTTRLLADMGAEVIQIESLDRIDPWRGGYPPHTSGVYPGGDPGQRPFDRNASYNSVNTGKLGITLDLNDVAARSALFELVSISDIVAENFSARVLPNLGLEYPVLRRVNPTVVLLRMPAYGSSGPYLHLHGQRRHYRADVGDILPVGIRRRSADYVRRDAYRPILRRDGHRRAAHSPSPPAPELGRVRR